MPHLSHWRQDAWQPQGLPASPPPHPGPMAPGAWVLVLGTEPWFWAGIAWALALGAWIS